jgi:hypothetical protein
MNNKYLTEVFEGRLDSEPLEEIVYVTRQICPDLNMQIIRDLHAEVTGYFDGSHPAFKKNILPYHNLKHTIHVVLASVRLFHGLHCNSVTFSTDTLLKGILAAYFHDTGMLERAGENADSAGDFIADHEARSMEFLRKYCEEKDFSRDVAEDCSTIIQYTILDLDPATLKFHSHEIQIAGQVVGSADILAQMADRYYLECLPLLFSEQKKGRVNTHDTALELMVHTANFYYNVVLKRLITTFSNTSRFMQTHFRERHMIDRNLYKENIDKNIKYLKLLVDKCNDLDCLTSHLKRKPPAT